LEARLVALERALGDISALSAAYKPHPSTTIPPPAAGPAAPNNVLPAVFTSKLLVLAGKSQADDKNPAPGGTAGGGGAAPPGGASTSSSSSSSSSAPPSAPAASTPAAAAGATPTTSTAAAAAAAGAAASADKHKEADSKDGVPSKPGPTSVANELAELHAQWKRMADSAFQRFFTKYEELTWLLESESSAATLALSTSAKRSVLTSGARDFAHTARLLEAATKLLPTLDAQPIQNLPSVVSALRNVCVLVEARTSAAQKLHNEIDQFIDLYNSVMDMLARKFLLFDAKLSQWEAMVDAKAK